MCSAVNISHQAVIYPGIGALHFDPGKIRVALIAKDIPFVRRKHRGYPEKTCLTLVIPGIPDRSRCVFIKQHRRIEICPLLGNIAWQESPAAYQALRQGQSAERPMHQIFKQGKRIRFSRMNDQTPRAYPAAPFKKCASAVERRVFGTNNAIDTWPPVMRGDRRVRVR